MRSFQNIFSKICIFLAGGGGGGGGEAGVLRQQFEYFLTSIPITFTLRVLPSLRNFGFHPR